MTKTVHGKVRGNTIEVDEDLGIADGEEVEIIVTAAMPQRAWGEGIRRSAGAAADDPEFDEVFEQIEQDRKAARFRETNV